MRESTIGLTRSTSYLLKRARHSTLPPWAMYAISSCHHDSVHRVISLISYDSYMAYDIISEIGFGAPFGFVETGTDVGNLIQGFHEGMPIAGVLFRLYPFTNLLRKTWLGQKYLVGKPEDRSGIGMVMRFRDKLIAQRLEDIENNSINGRVDMLQS